MKITCVNCDYKTIWGSKILLHLIVRHRIKPTKKDLKFAWKNGAESTIVLFPIACLMMGLYFASFPFWWIHEKISTRVW